MLLVTKNKIPQGTPCGATIVASVRFTSKLSVCIHIFGEEKLEKFKVPTFFEIWARGHPTEDSSPFCFHRKILSLKTYKTLGLFYFFFQFGHNVIFSDFC